MLNILQLEDEKSLSFDYDGHELPIMTENYTLYNRTFYDLQPNTAYAFQLAILYKSSYDLYHWPKSDSDLQFVFKTLSKLD